MKQAYAQTRSRFGPIVLPSHVKLSPSASTRAQGPIRLLPSPRLQIYTFALHEPRRTPSPFLQSVLRPPDVGPPTSGRGCSRGVVLLNSCATTMAAPHAQCCCWDVSCRKRETKILFTETRLAIIDYAVHTMQRQPRGLSQDETNDGTLSKKWYCLCQLKHVHFVFPLVHS